MTETNSKELKQVFQAILELKDISECQKFFRDLCTMSELQAISERWQVVKLLDKGLPYRKIAELTGASTATITRVSHWLHHGEGGYRLLLQRCK